MADTKLAKASINLKASLCPDSPTGADIFAFGDPEARVLENTGIERMGGVTNIYEKETTFATAGANSIITADGKLLQVDASNNVRLDNVVLGNVGPCAVYRRGMLPGWYLDAAWTVTGTIIGIKKAGTTITVDEYDPATGTVTNTRDIVFAGMPTVNILNIALVKYVDMTYAANQEILVGLSTIANWRLRESDLSSTELGIVNAFNHMWRFSAGNYLLWWQGKPGSCDIGDIGAWTDLADVKWVIIDRFVGTTDSRAILTFDPYKNAANTFSGMAVVGYNGAGAYDPVRSYKGVALGVVTVVVTNPITGPGYSECSYVRSDDTPLTRYYLAPQPRHNPTAYHQTALIVTGASPGINGYGKLNDVEDNNTFLTSLRVCMINGVPSYLSIAPITAATTTYDHIGVPITNVGEFDETFMPHVADNNSTFTKVIYRYADNLFFVDVRSGQTKSISKLSPIVYQINTISAFNIIDTTSRLMQLGVNDYNGRIISYTGAAITDRAVAVLKSQYANSIDTGEKLGLLGSFIGYAIPGMNKPTFVDRNINYAVDSFANGVYATSYDSYSTFLPNLSKAGTLYIPDTRLPIAMGYTHGDGTVQTEFSTIFTGIAIIGSPDTEFGYAGYELGNDITGLFQSFTLFGQRYLFDGFQIWLASFTNVAYAGKQFLCPATGMTLIATSPTAVYFLSAFDNSIYTFDGGRTLTKLVRMNDVPVISQGVFNVRDNTLLLETTTSLIWVRDGVITENAKKATQTGLNLYDTQLGIVIANNTVSWQYSFSVTGSTSIVGLTWQSAYHGLLNNILSLATTWVITLYSATRQTAAVVLTCYSFDQGKTYTNTAPITIKPADWDSQGFYRCRIQPKNQLALASSVKISTPPVIENQCITYAKVVITDVSVEYSGDAFAVTAASRSK